LQLTLAHADALSPKLSKAWPQAGILADIARVEAIGVSSFQPFL
jgi:hypothetical protein